MMVIVKYFNEKTDQDYETYNKLWEEHKERFVFLHTNVTPKQQMNSIINDLDDNKDILAVRFPRMNTINKNKIINNILLGKGIEYDNKKWYPKEIWVYSPI
jgi:hypothetical protein